MNISQQSVEQQTLWEYHEQCSECMWCNTAAADPWVYICVRVCVCARVRAHGHGCARNKGYCQSKSCSSTGCNSILSWRPWINEADCVCVQGQRGCKSCTLWHLIIASPGQRVRKCLAYGCSYQLVFLMLKQKFKVRQVNSSENLQTQAQLKPSKKLHLTQI